MLLMLERETIPNEGVCGIGSEYGVLFLILWSLINIKKAFKLYDLRVSRVTFKGSTKTYYRGL